MLRAALNAALAAVLIVGGVLAQEPLPVDVYWQRLEEMRALVDSLAAEPSDVAQAQLCAAAGEWADIDRVVLHDGTAVTVDHGYLVALLCAQPADPARVSAVLDTLLAADRAPVPAAFRPQDAKALDEILAQPEFQWGPSPLQTWWEQLGQQIREFLARLFPQAAQDGGVRVNIPLGSVLVTVVSVLVLVFVLAYVLRDVGGIFVAEARLAAEAETGDANLTASSALQKAHTLSAGKDYRTAMRYLYLSTLLLLEERGVLRYDRTLTNREYVDKLKSFPTLARTFRDVVGVFDRVWYGQRSLSADDFEDYVAKVEALKPE